MKVVIKVQEGEAKLRNGGSLSTKYNRYDKFYYSAIWLAEGVSKLQVFIVSLPLEMSGTCERGDKETLGVSRIEDYRRTWPSELNTQISHGLTNTEVQIFGFHVSVPYLPGPLNMLQSFPALGTLILIRLLYSSSFDMKTQNSALTQYLETLTQPPLKGKKKPQASENFIQSECLKKLKHSESKSTRISH